MLVQSEAIRNMSTIVCMCHLSMTVNSKSSVYNTHIIFYRNVTSPPSQPNFKIGDNVVHISLCSYRTDKWTLGLAGIAT